MYGISWSAFNALMVAHRKPPALKAIIAAHGSTDLFYNSPVFKSVRNEQTGDSTFTTSSDTIWTLHDNTYRSTELYQWDVNDAAPANARYRGERRNVFVISGNEIDISTLARIESDATYFHITFTKTLRENGSLIRERTWTDLIPRRYQ